MDKTKIIIMTFILLLSLFVFYQISSNNLKLSYASYISACHPNNLGDEYIAYGQTISNYSEGELTSSTIQISSIIDPNSSLYLEILQHEKCHVTQSKRNNKILSCNYPIRKIFSEIECYTVDELPSKIFDFLY